MADFGLAIVGVGAGVVGAGAGVVQALATVWPSFGNKFTSLNNAGDIRGRLDYSLNLIRSMLNAVETETNVSYEEWICDAKEIVDTSWSDSNEDMKNMLKKADNLVNKFHQIKVDPPRVVKRKTQDIRGFDTLRKPLEKILNLLECPEDNEVVKGIHIHGAIGIGKTTIMENLNNHEQVTKRFDIVIWLQVSNSGSSGNFSREQLQKDIVERLELQMVDTSNAKEVAKRISKKLAGKKCLLLLDDVKEDLDLDDIGIPLGDSDCKIVLTSKNRIVCHSIVDVKIDVELLTESEAWLMFRDVLKKPKLTEDENIGPIARQVCRRCCRLPLLIVNVANTFKMKEETRSSWEDGLDRWRHRTKTECDRIKEVYEWLKVCFYELVDDQHKNCFLYGALYPEGTDIDTTYLLECWEAEDLLVNGDDSTENYSFTNGISILDFLKDVSLFVEGKSENHVAMHKFIRQMALCIFNDDPNYKGKYLVKPDEGLSKARTVTSWGEKNRISLGAKALDELPKSPNCPMLSSLFLHNNLNLTKIDDTFFDDMRSVRVVYLSHTGIRSLPSSISNLTDLKNLYLIGCKNLKEVLCHIAQLEKLEVLDIRGSVVNIPRHIEKLVNLRCLRVSFTESGNENATQGVYFNYHMISKLSRLEELVIDVNSSTEQFPNEVEEIVKKVVKLDKFRRLSFCFPKKVVDVIRVTPMTFHICSLEAESVMLLMERISERDVQRIFIGSKNTVPQIPKSARYSKYVEYSNGAGSNFPIPEVLAEADAFALVNHKEFKQLSDFGTANMNKVRGCLIKSCDAIETIMDTVDDALLPNLEHLYMKALPKLESIWKGPAQPEIISKLTILVLTNCPMLVKIFPPNTIQQLREIQYLKIEDCKEIEEIIAESDAVGNLCVLPKLEELILLDMPKLRSICAIESLEWPSLEKLEICKCPLLKLPFNKDNAAKLKVIKAEQHWWDALPWQDEEVKERLQKLCTLRSY